jgi:hypothetical protein
VHLKDSRVLIPLLFALLLLVPIAITGTNNFSKVNLGTLNPTSVYSSHGNSLTAVPANLLQYAFFPREPRLQDVTPISGFAPIGMASYGSAANPIRTNGVKGEVTFNGIGVGYFSAEEINYSTAALYNGIGNATLQENAVLWMGNLGTYWTQNVIFIIQDSPSTYTLQLVNNVWNFTSITSNMNQRVTNGTGQVQCLNTSGAISCFYYSVDSAAFTVTTPFKVVLSMVTTTGNAAASVLFQYQVSDSTGANFTGQYDDVQLYPFQQPVTSYFQIGGVTPVTGSLGGGTTLTLPSDLELVLGGPGGGSAVYLNSIDASQQLFYQNNASYVPVPDAYSIGSDTGEQASGATVTPNLSSPSNPQAVLSSGPDSAQKLWPLPLSFFVTGTNNFQNETLNLEGQALYSVNSSSNILPASNLTILESQSHSYLLSNSNGVFGIGFTPNSTGTFDDVFSYGGSVAFYPANVTVHIAVSSINVSSAAKGELVGIFNSTRILIPSNTSTILVPVLSGTNVIATFQNLSNGTDERELFIGFTNSSSTATLQGALSDTVAFTGNTSQATSANFVTQYLVTIENAYTGQFTSQWYNQSSTVDFSAPSSVNKGGQALSFSGWLVNGGTGSASQTSSSSLVVEGPLVISAEYVYSSAIVYEIVIGIVALIVGVFAGYVLSRRRRASWEKLP